MKNIAFKAESIKDQLWVIEADIEEIKEDIREKVNEIGESLLMIRNLERDLECNLTAMAISGADDSQTVETLEKLRGIEEKLKSIL